MSRRLQDAPEHWSEIGGMPDAWDKKNIQALINKFERSVFEVEGMKITGKQYIRMIIAEAKASHRVGDAFNTKNVKIKDTNMRAVAALPPELNTELLKAYPTIARNQEHFAWFIKNFKQFMIAEEF